MQFAQVWLVIDYCGVDDIVTEREKKTTGICCVLKKKTVNNYGNALF